MLKIYDTPKAYDDISRDIENNFHLHLGKTKKEIKTIVVVGGYIFSEGRALLLNYPNATIHVFEPVAEFINRAKEYYKGIDRCKFYNIAIGNMTGEVDFFRTSSSGSDSMFKVIENNKSGYSFNNVDTIKVQCDKLSNIIDTDIDLLSVDVQGAEMEVLRGTDLGRVDSIFAEVQLTENKHQQVYEGQCFMEDINQYLGDVFYLHSMGLDNELRNGTGNAFWARSI